MNENIIKIRVDNKENTMQITVKPAYQYPARERYGHDFYTFEVPYTVEIGRLYFGEYLKQRDTLGLSEGRLLFSGTYTQGRWDYERYYVWYPHLNPYPRQGKETYEFVEIEVRKDGKLELRLTPDGEYLIEELREAGVPEIDISYELLEEALCNGWSFDGEYDESLTQVGLDDNGDFDYQPGDLTWVNPNHAVAFWFEDCLRTGRSVWDCWHMGHTSLDEQGYLSL